MKLGGFVIHGNNRDTLAACLHSLLAVSDEVVAVDSCSEDGSARLDAALGVRRVELAWQGYGAARAAATRALAGCDYLFFLDADERLTDRGAEAIRRWRESSPRRATYRVRLEDWASLSGRRFLYRRSARRRLFRIDAARWTPAMIVHESVGEAQTANAEGVVVEHRFATTLAERARRNERYALLWAVQALVEGRPGKSVMLQRVAHFLRDAFIRGAAFRGGVDALRLCAVTSRYHAAKYDQLRRLREGERTELVDLYRRGELRRFFVRTEELLAGDGGSPSPPADSSEF